MMSSGGAVQIITPVNQKFETNLDYLKRILSADQIKDRNVVIVSVAGALRKGKSFLLNFFLKYLNAQYKKHDVSDWLGEKETGNRLNGFEFAGGHQPKTTGIYMWSEIFTHDFANGEKVAILLMDTQGIFDSRTSLKNNTTIFAISMMLSSVQCCNVMQNIQEDDLQNLELFTEYGRLAMQQTNEIPFHKLLFIIRDWPHPTEIPYGNGETYIDEILNESSDHTTEMKQLRSRLKASFNEIGAYLMPSPGSAVATGRNINGDLSQIDAEFIEHLKSLVPSILAPENLILKKINGQKIRARDLVTYLQTYVTIFNDEETPRPNTVMAGTALASIMAAFIECLDFYVDSMNQRIEEKSHNEIAPYFNQIEFKEIHDDAKANALSKFAIQPTLGGDEIVRPFRNKLAKDIQTKYNSFRQANEEKENNSKAIAKANIQVLYMDCSKFYNDSMYKSTGQIESFLNQRDLQQMHESTKHESFLKFEAQQLRNNNELNQTFRDKLENEIGAAYNRFQQENENKRKFTEDLKNKTAEAAAKARAEAREEQMQMALAEARADAKNLELFNNCLGRYTNGMQKTLIESDSFYGKSQLNEIHESIKQNILSKFKTEQDNSGRDSMLQYRLENAMDMSYVHIKYVNDEKRRDFQEKTELLDSNKKLQDELKERASESDDNIFSGLLSTVVKAMTSLFQL
ncbi:atlastin-like [Contarinia nasturtii]|uniref:atlastin-like n=1 Tax=Contarinia nasturtii TaxID=265458 RepID=UPI0012D43D70|nr:atlastin-like [Contarinia nasturtii]